MKIKALLMLLVFFPLIGCDRVTKEMASTHLKGQDSMSFLDGIFRLTYYENTGGMLSFGSNFPDPIRFIVFTALVGLVLTVGLIYILRKPMDKLSFTAGLLILAGGFGNLYDRVAYDGRVVDFMLLQLGPIRSGVFNVADVAIMVGLIGLFFLSSKSNQHIKKNLN